jgi:hypothetical protein
VYFAILCVVKIVHGPTAKAVEVTIIHSWQQEIKELQLKKI